MEFSSDQIASDITPYRLVSGLPRAVRSVAGNILREQLYSRLEAEEEVRSRRLYENLDRQLQQIHRRSEQNQRLYNQTIQTTKGFAGEMHEFSEEVSRRQVETEQWLENVKSRRIMVAEEKETEKAFIVDKKLGMENRMIDLRVLSSPYCDAIKEEVRYIFHLVWHYRRTKQNYRFRTMEDFKAHSRGCLEIYRQHTQPGGHKLYQDLRKEYLDIKCKQHELVQSILLRCRQQYQKADEVESYMMHLRFIIAGIHFEEYTDYVTGLPDGVARLDAIAALIDEVCEEGGGIVYSNEDRLHFHHRRWQQIEHRTMEMANLYHNRMAETNSSNILFSVPLPFLLHGLPKAIKEEAHGTFLFEKHSILREQQDRDLEALKVSLRDFESRIKARHRERDEGQLQESHTNQQIDDRFAALQQRLDAKVEELRSFEMTNR